MRDPKQKTENALLKRLKRLFRRNKTSEPKQKKELTSADRDKRAFNISIWTAVAFLFFLIIYLFARKDLPLTFSDNRVLSVTVASAGFISAWLARKGKSSLGIAIFLTAFYAVELIAGATISGTGIILCAFSMAVSLAITSAVMVPSTAKIMNTFALIVSSIPIILDIFEPFPRPADPTPVPTLIMTIISVAAYAAVVVRRFNTYNLRTKLIIAFAAVTVLPLIGVGFYDNLKLSDALYQNGQDTLTEFANQTALQVDNLIEHQLTSISIESRNPPFIQFLSLSQSEKTNTPEKEIALKALTTLTSEDKTFIYSYRLLDEKGLVVLDTDSQQGQDQSQTPFFKAAITQDKATINGPLINQQNRRASLYFSAPVKNESGKLLGVLVAEYNTGIIEATVKQLIQSDSAKGILFQVVDAEHFTQIANTNDSTLLYKSYKDYSPDQVINLQKQGFLLPGSVKDALAIQTEIMEGLENLDKSASFVTLADKTLQTKNLNSAAKLKNAPWLALVSQSEEAVLAPLAQQKRATATIFIILLILITLAAFGLSQLLASPILNLASTAQKIAAGDLTLQSDIESNDEIGTLATAFNQMTRQTRTLINSLEQRSKALATSSEVSRRISTILDQQELVTEVVKQVQMAFGYYHAHIYLLDENTQELIMAGGTGEAGKAMLARHHKIPMGKGLVGRAAQNNITVLVANVAEEPQWLPNPLLPDTKSEVAVPIAIAERVLGVLDVQHNVADTLKQEDVDVLQSIANQVAFAVRNARSYSEVQAKADREALISSIGQKIQGTITVESAIQVAIREIGRALNGAKTQVVLNENSNPDHLSTHTETTTQSEN